MKDRNLLIKREPQNLEQQLAALKCHVVLIAEYCEIPLSKAAEFLARALVNPINRDR